MDESYGVVVSFDLSMDMLDKYYPGGRANRARAYGAIRSFLKSHGYEHLRDSDYKNNDDTMQGCYDKILVFNENNKWFSLCVNKLIIMPGSLYCDYTDLLKDNIDEEYKEHMERP